MASLYSIEAIVYDIVIKRETAWVLTQALTAKLDKFERKCYLIMIEICQAETHMTNTDLYRMADEHPITEMIRQRYLQLNGHRLRMPKNNQLIFMSSIRTRSGGPTAAEI